MRSISFCASTKPSAARTSKLGFAAAFISTLLFSPAFAEIPAVERDKSVREGLAIVNGVNEKAKAMGAKYVRPANLEDAELVTNVSSKSLMTLLQDGFLTIHAGLASGGDHDQEKRLKVESAIAGKPLTQKYAAGEGKYVMPKYAYLISPDTTDVSHFGDYGDIFLVLKPGVKKRMTWSPSDSFDFEDSISGSPASAQSALLKRGLINTATHGLNRGELAGRYLEAQIWGALDAKSVAEVVFPRLFAPEDWMYPHVEALFKKLNQMGIQISYFEPAAYPDCIGLNQFENFKKRVKVPLGEYPKAIHVATPEERQKNMIECGGEPSVQTAEDLAKDKALEAKLLRQLAK